MERLRLLWVTPDVPRRGVSAARAYWWALLARLAPRHEVTLLCFADATDAAIDDLPPGITRIRVVTRRPFTPDDPYALLPQAVAGRYADPVLRDAIATELAARPYDLAQYEFVETANLVPDTGVPAGIPTILAVHQVGFAAQGPRWRAEGYSLGSGAVLLHRYLRELDFELRAAACADHVVTVTAEDAARLRRFLPDLSVSVSPVGVDTHDFRPMPPPDDCRSDLLFVGNFIHPPNADAVRFLATRVLPRLGRDVRLHVVGHGAEAAVATISAGGVTAIGAVDDLKPWLAGATAVVAPVRFGTGMRGKVLEALAMGRPVVTTTLGAEGLGAIAGRHLLVADDAADFAVAVRRVLDDAVLRDRLGQDGRALVETRFDWDVVAGALEDTWLRVLHARSRRVRPPFPRFAIPVPPRLRGRLAVAAGALRLVGRGAAWHAQRLAGAPRAARTGHPVPLPG